MNPQTMDDPEPATRHWPNPLATAEYDRSPKLTVGERSAIQAWLKKRVLGQWSRFEYRTQEREQLLRLMKPIEDALAIIGSEAAAPNDAMMVLLRECLLLNRTYWGWKEQHWAKVLGRTTHDFFDRNKRKVATGVRVDIAAIAYLHNWFTSYSTLASTHRKSLANRIFGSASVASAIERLTTPLVRWGYRIDPKYMKLFVSSVLLVNRSPRLEDLNPEILEFYRAEGSNVERRYYYAISKVLANQGILEQPLERAPPRTKQIESIHIGVADEWCGWIERWTQTTTIETRRGHRTTLYKVGRWLAAHHPEIVSPAQWTRTVAAEFVSAMAKLRVGQYVAPAAPHPRAGEAVKASTIAGLICQVRGFFYDCQEWGWIERSFDPGRSFAIPQSIRANLGPKPRVIADDLWARLLWAGLNLEKSDVPRANSSGLLFDVEYIRAIAVVWLFAALRNNEIRRLRLGCIRWQPMDSGKGPPICLLDVPDHKTGNCYTKPVDPAVGEAIEAWQAIRPVQPAYPDPKTGDLVQFLFQFRAIPMANGFINVRLIPILCRKAGIPDHDVRGKLTSHRARATIASQLFNSEEPMTLSELQEWLGHRSPHSTQHYVKITPTKLAKAYTDAGYFERNARVVKVLIDRDQMKNPQEGVPWLHYDLGHGWCSFEFFDRCPHRMACARCDFYIPKASSRGQLLEAKDNVDHFLKAIPVTAEEQQAADGDRIAIDRLRARLDDEPTPSGPTPAELRQKAQKTSRKRVTRNST